MGKDLVSRKRQMKTPQDEISFWHARFTQQATWTDKLFFSLAEQSGFDNATSILEVGCGTGAALKRLHQLPAKVVYGLDIRRDFLLAASQYAPLAHLVHGDAHNLPFGDNRIDLTFCHFLLMWVQSPETVLQEMRRVTSKNGWVVALAEPDYDHRIDMPESLAQLGKDQGAALRAQGADPGIGRRLAELFHDAGIRLEATGILGGYWGGPGLPTGWELEWETLRNDLKDFTNSKELDKLMEIDRKAWLDSVRILFVPLFYAIGRV